MELLNIHNYKENLYIKDTVAGPNTVFTVLFNLCNKKTSVLWTITEVPTSSLYNVDVISILYMYITVYYNYYC